MLRFSFFLFTKIYSIIEKSFKYVPQNKKKWRGGIDRFFNSQIFQKKLFYFL